MVDSRCERTITVLPTVSKSGGGSYGGCVAVVAIFSVELSVSADSGALFMLDDSFAKLVNNEEE